MGSPKIHPKNYFIPHSSSLHVYTSVTNSNLLKVEWCANPDTLVDRAKFELKKSAKFEKIVFVIENKFVFV